MKPVIFGLSSTKLSDAEATFFRDVDPAGYILFGRNIADRTTLRALTDSLRGLSGRDDLPILIDQEGGRVARLKAPHWPELPAADRFACAFEIAPISAIEAAHNNGQAIARLLRDVGINVNCAPVLDVRTSETHDAIGDRSFGDDPAKVAALGKAFLDGIARGGVHGVIKHMPGQGRATCDSHHDLPVVNASAKELEKDIAPFRALRGAAFAMTCHVRFDAWDINNCVTMSAKIIREVIRQQIGFSGILMSDDLTMHALEGEMADRAKACLAAGCDLVLHCSGDIAEMASLAAALPDMAADKVEQLAATMAQLVAPEDVDFEALAAKRDSLLAIAA